MLCGYVLKIANMLFELQFPNPVGNSTYRQHQYVDAILWATRPDGYWRPRDYLWCENDGVFFVRRPLPTNDLVWRPVTIPPECSMITMQLQARCRHASDGDRKDMHHPTVRRGARHALLEPGDNLDWLDQTAARIGLHLEDAEVDLVRKTIDKPIKKIMQPGPQFTLVLANFTAVASVVDEAQFERALSFGVGDSKAFGCGFIHFWQRGQ